MHTNVLCKLYDHSKNIIKHAVIDEDEYLHELG